MTTFDQRLALFEHRAEEIVPSIRRGIEKESLRIAKDGKLSQRDHPQALGSALTHPSITTDYSEALIELVTPTFSSVDETLQCLDELHRIVYYHCPDEMLWVNSLPCLLGDESDIPIAKFGTSNIGRMKHIYRRGLGLRYGRKMQTIAGIHYNISMPEAFWEQLATDSIENLQTTSSSGYMAGIRNFHRYCWLLFYLFGASPAACSSFFDTTDVSGLSKLGSHTLYGPHATSMRMSNLGYRNPVQSEIHIDHNSVEGYAQSLSRNTKTAYPEYERHGIKKDGKYIQLNPNLLQIENEYYSVIRPKRTSRPLEKPTCALMDRGIEYLELRCMDLDPYSPIGISDTQARFLDLFVVFCLLKPSLDFNDKDTKVVALNKDAAVMSGRKPGLPLIDGGARRTLASWGKELLDEIEVIAEIFDKVLEDDRYAKTVRRQREVINEPEATPSARIVEELRRSKHPFFTYAMRKASETKVAFNRRPPSTETLLNYERLATQSLLEQQAMEQNENVDFEEFLAVYFSD